jgi:hypothetical protein
MAQPVWEGAVDSPHSTLTLARTFSSGAVVSTNVILCTALAELSQQSVAVQVRVIVMGQVPLELSE